MTWVAWRQFRAWALVATLGAGALAALLLVTAHHLAVLYAGSGVASCAGQGCQSAAQNFLSQISADHAHLAFLIGITATYAFPAAVGVFWGAPLIAHELERGTFRLAWTQSVTRRRWLGVKLAVAGLATVAVASTLSLLISRWPVLIHRAASLASSTGGFNTNRFAPGLFGAGGVLPVAAAAFGFVAGVAIGVVIRRTLPAMALTLAAVVVAMMVMGFLAPHLLPAQRLVMAANNWNLTRLAPGADGLVSVGVAAPPGAWVLSESTLDGSGRRVAGVPAALSPVGIGACTQTEPYSSCLAELARRGYAESVTFQPASRYWPLQWAAAGLYAAAVLALLVFLRRAINGVRP